ncbi:uncharacterized protein At3g17950-like isoform X1 [Punica granatum]|uniref:Uncharacterized protein At3g17950-like isoform X1 n=1 Tax=Punica granatum TaxID=22663 RepID=A0A6P8CMF2_PUNGR|nr:uncharacterized protein At3g17950-like isoform X1 [Punica granatum]XP_031385437.1 uncharacterized protein At3g17950-like isoform X1 [Punica granatum]
MAPPQLQEGGWPLGLQPVNVRAGLSLGTHRELLSRGSVSLNTPLTASPTHSPSTGSSSSSDLDSESTGSSFFQERNITFGRLIGASSTLDLSKRSSASRRSSLKSSQKPNRNSKPNLLWSFSTCCRDSSDVEVVKNYSTATAGAPPLSHLLAVERGKSVRRWRRGQLGRGEYYGPYDGLGLTGLTPPESNTLFVDGRIAPPPRSSPWSGSDGDQMNDTGSSVIFSWICSRQS